MKVFYILTINEECNLKNEIMPLSGNTEKSNNIRTSYFGEGNLSSVVISTVAKTLFQEDSKYVDEKVEEL